MNHVKSLTINGLGGGDRAIRLPGMPITSLESIAYTRCNLLHTYLAGKLLGRTSGRFVARILLILHDLLQFLAGRRVPGCLACLISGFGMI